MSKVELIEVLATIKTNPKQTAFLGAVYLLVLRENSVKGLYFGALRNFLAEILPHASKEGKFGSYLPQLSEIMKLLIEKEVVEVEERKNKAKFHIIKEIKEINEIIGSLNDRYGEKFVKLVNQAKDLYASENGGSSSFSADANDFCNFNK